MKISFVTFMLGQLLKRNNEVEIERKKKIKNNTSIICWCFSAVILNAVNSLFSTYDKLSTTNVDAPNTWHVLAKPPKLVTLSINDPITISFEAVECSSRGRDGIYFLWAFWELLITINSFVETEKLYSLN